jgi:hypothetical protein
MDAWQGVGTAVVAGLVSAAVALMLRFWEGKRVAWVVTGEAHDEFAGGRVTGMLRATVQFHNVGDGDAFGVFSRRQNGAELEPFEVFEAGKVASGESVVIVMSVHPDDWESARVELHWAPSPTARSRSGHEAHLLHEALWRMGGFPAREDLERRRRMPRPARRR